MELPNDPLVWIIAILVLGVVVLVALILGGRVEVGLDPLRLSFRRKQAAGQDKVSVLDEAEIEDAEVGNVTGVSRQAEDDSGGQVTDISVARGARIKGGKLGDISGMTVTGGGAGKTPGKPGDGAKSGN